MSNKASTHLTAKEKLLSHFLKCLPQPSNEIECAVWECTQHSDSGDSPEWGLVSCYASEFWGSQWIATVNKIAYLAERKGEHGVAVALVVESIAKTNGARIPDLEKVWKLVPLADEENRRAAEIEKILLDAARIRLISLY